MKINKFHSPYVLICLSSIIQGSAHQPQTTSSILASLSAANADSAPLDRRLTAPPKLDLTAANAANTEYTALASPPPLTLNQSANNGQSATAPSPGRPLSVSSTTVTLGANGIFNTVASPSLQTHSVNSVSAAQFGGNSRRGSISGPLMASPGLRAMSTPKKKLLEKITDSQANLGRLAEALATELSILIKSLEEPLTPRTKATIEKDIAICVSTAQAAGYLRLDVNTKKAALFPASPAALTAASTSISPNSQSIQLSATSPATGGTAAVKK